MADRKKLGVVKFPGSTDEYDVYDKKSIHTGEETILVLDAGDATTNMNTKAELDNADV